MLQNNKLRKYFVYALGEILLVMIGILLALQVNNWNEVRKDELELKDYLFEIQNNISKDITVAKSQLERRDSIRAWNITARDLAIEEQYPVWDFIKAQAFWYEFYFIPLRTGFDALKNSGLKSILRNTAIDSLLNEYYFNLETIAQRESSYNMFIENMEKEFRTQFSSIKYNHLIRSYYDSLEYKKPKEYSKLQSALKPYFQSNVFQSAVFRSAAQGHSSLDQLIIIGEELMESINEYIDV